MKLIKDMFAKIKHSWETRNEPPFSDIADLYAWQCKQEKYNRETGLEELENI